MSDIRHWSLDIVHYTLDILIHPISVFGNILNLFKVSFGIGLFGVNFGPVMFMGFVEGLFWVLIFSSFNHRRRRQFSSVLDLDSGRLFEVGAPAGWAHI